MTTIGRAIVIKGEVRATGDLLVEGHIEGPVWCEDAALTLGESAEVRGDIVARDVTVFGRVSGQIVGTEVVDVRRPAVVDGRVIALRFILEDGAGFNGRVEPQHLETAVRVAKFQQKRQPAV
jgi:cytoskeletal protein CcmA (bactofilin family)